MFYIWLFVNKRLEKDQNQQWTDPANKLCAYPKPDIAYSSVPKTIIITSGSHTVFSVSVC